MCCPPETQKLLNVLRGTSNFCLEIHYYFSLSECMYTIFTIYMVLMVPQVNRKVHLHIIQNKKYTHGKSSVTYCRNYFQSFGEISKPGVYIELTHFLVYISRNPSNRWLLTQTLHIYFRNLNNPYGDISLQCNEILTSNCVIPG